MLQYFLRTVHDHGDKLTETDLDKLLAECVAETLQWCNPSMKPHGTTGQAETTEKATTATRIREDLQA